MPEDIGFYIDDVCIPHACYPIEAGRSGQLTATHDAVAHVVSIDPGNYTVKNLDVTIAAAINKMTATFKRASVGTRNLESSYLAKTHNL